MTAKTPKMEYRSRGGKYIAKVSCPDPECPEVFVASRHRGMGEAKAAAWQDLKFHRRQTDH
jgi:hypothetical protein